MMLFSGVINITGTSFLMFSVFIVVFIGFLLGRITIRGVNLGSAGTFIIALLYGALFSDHLSSTISKNIDGKNENISSNCLKIVENIGLIFFIGAVGNISGPTFFTNLKKNFKSYILIDLVIILMAALTCIACFHIGKNHEKNLDEFAVMTIGIFSGALSSTPAFSAAKSSAAEEYQSAVTVGYAITYIFSVIGIVLFVQFVPKIVGANMEEERALLIANNTDNNSKNSNKVKNISKQKENDNCSENCDIDKIETKKVEMKINQVNTEDEFISSKTIQIQKKQDLKDLWKIGWKIMSDVVKFWGLGASMPLCVERMMKGTGWI